MTTASIVTYNTSLEELDKLLYCLDNSTIAITYIIDHSEDDLLRSIAKKHNNTEYIHQKNIGYGAGHNVAIRKAIEYGSAYHVVINPDIFWTDNVIPKLTEFMDSNPSCGLVMPKILYPDGRIQYVCKLIPSPVNLLLRRFIPIKWMEKHNISYEMRWTGYRSIMEIPILSGCFMFIRCETLKKTGIFDERYFLYCEDVDLCRRIGNVAQTIFYPYVSVFHTYSKGSYRQLRLLLLHMVSAFKYFNKWGWWHDPARDKRNADCIDKIQHNL